MLINKSYDDETLFQIHIDREIVRIITGYIWIAYEVDNSSVISIKFYHNLTGSNYYIYQSGSIHIFFSKSGTEVFGD